MDWKTLVSIILILLLIPIIITGTTAMLGAKAKDALVQIWGIKGQLYVGGLGTTLHEAGHALMALAFHHYITGLKLCRFKNLDTAKTLGYVRHSYNPDSFYQMLGNFFIGIAPFFSCTGTLLLCHRLLIGTHYHFNIGVNSQSSRLTIQNVLWNCWSNLQNSWSDDIHYPLYALIFTVIVIAVSVTGYAISVQDWRNTLSGATQYLIVVIVLSVLVLFLISLDNQLKFYAWDTIAFLVFLMADSWLYVLSSIAIIYLIKYFIYHNQSRYQVTVNHWHIISDLKQKFSKH